MDVRLTPMRYVQHPGVLEMLPEHLAASRAVLAVADELVWGLVGEGIAAAVEGAGIGLARWPFPGETTPRAVAELAAVARGQAATCLLGVGGGKAIDLAKAAAGKAGCPVITLPTSAATCAGTSNVAVLYEDLRYVGTEAGPTPVACLVDPEVAGRAPARLLAAGMADALAKWEEGSAVTDLGRADGALRLAARIAEDAHEAILAHGLEAHADACAGRVSDAVLRILEINLLATGLVSCLGGIHFRTAAAHAIYYGLTRVGRRFRGLHGEVVGFGLVVQALVLGRQGHAERLARFLGKMGVPLTLGELGAPQEGWALETFLDGIFRPGSSLYSLPRPPVRERVRYAILEASALGRTQ